MFPCTSDFLFIRSLRLNMRIMARPALLESSSPPPVWNPLSLTALTPRSSWPPPSMWFSSLLFIPTPSIFWQIVPSISKQNCSWRPRRCDWTEQKDWRIERSDSSGTHRGSKRLSWWWKINFNVFWRDFRVWLVFMQVSRAIQYEYVYTLDIIRISIQWHIDLHIEPLSPLQGMFKIETGQHLELMPRKKKIKQMTDHLFKNDAHSQNPNADRLRPRHPCL